MQTISQLEKDVQYHLPADSMIDLSMLTKALSPADKVSRESLPLGILLSIHLQSRDLHASSTNTDPIRVSLSLGRGGGRSVDWRVFAAGAGELHGCS